MKRHDGGVLSEGGNADADHADVGKADVGKADAEIRNLPTEPLAHRRSNPPDGSLATLTVVHSPDADLVGSAFELGNKTRVEIGRNPPPEGISVLDRQMSRSHFRVSYDQSQRWFRITDLSSRNGTFVEGDPVLEVMARDLCVIRAGESVFVLAANRLVAPPIERARVLAKTGLPVLIRGETGTGKERMARLMHVESGRLGKFIAVDCASLPRDLITAELFGHAKGAFSGAHLQRPGLFRAAEGGTLFLDEIGDMPLELQPSLLRALQEGAVRPVGTETEVKVDVRVVAATHADVGQMMRDGQFRSDLYARLAKSELVLPPLRERPLEIMPLALEFARGMGRELKITAEAGEALLTASWPRNIRELESVIHLFCSTEDEGKALDLDFLYEHKRELLGVGESGSKQPDAPVREAGTAEIVAALEAAGGNVSIAAKRLGMSRYALYRRMKVEGIELSSFRN